MAGLPSVPEFDPRGDPCSIGIRWKKWKRSFEFYLAARGDTPQEQKRALLLHLAGSDVQDIFETLPSGGDTYDQTMTSLDAYFLPKVNETYERHVFRQLVQREDETVDQFVTRLRQQAARCAFGDKQDEMIRDQVVDKLPAHSRRLKQKLLERTDLTLTILQEVARAHEAAEIQVKKMDNSETVNAMKGRRRPPPSPGKASGSAWSRPTSSAKEKACFRCGRSGHLAKDPKCPARGKTCSKCQKPGHFAAVCRSKQTLHCVNTESERETDDFAFIVGQGTGLESVSILCGGVELKALIDSGASCNIIDRRTWENLKARKVKCNTQSKCSRQLYAYGSKVPLDVLGSFTADVSLPTGRDCVDAKFLVINGKGQSLLGRETAEKLNVLRVGLPEQVQQIDDENPDFVRKHSKLFSGFGKLKNHQVKLHVKAEEKPVAQPPRRIPFSLRSRLEAKIAELESADIIEAVEGPTPWVSPAVIVPKPSGDIRLCVDMRQANKAVERERHVIPTVEETLAEMNGSTVFSKLDLKWGFHQLELAEESRPITTFSTHCGLYRYKRLNFGITSAPEVYQHTIQQVLQGCEGATNISDDIVVHGRSVAEHDQRLEKVLQRLEECGLTLNADKCMFRLPQLEFMGFVLSDKGTSPAASKIEAVRDARRPETASEVRSFMGLVNFNARFIRDLATKAEPLHRLTRNGSKFQWTGEQEKAFQTLKKDLASANTLAYFDTNAAIRVVADASPVGLGAVLVQTQHGIDRVVSYASRSLTDVERRYSQTEKEALALVWACERFHQYLYGLHFTLETDHKPLEVIYSPRSKPSARIERWVLRLQAYDFEVKYRPGSQNIADTLSRLIRETKKVETDRAEEFVRFVAQTAVPRSMSIQEIEAKSASDSELKAVGKCIQTGDWTNCPNSTYRLVKDELCQLGQLVIRGTRIVIPRCLRQQVVDLAHEGHQGIVKTKANLRSKVWWPAIDKDAETRCRSCHGCQIVSQPQVPEPMVRTRFPEKPWQDLALDLLGPLPTGESLLVVVDYYSRYFEVAVMKSVTSTKIIRELNKVFATHGLPESVRTDNGTQFVSREFSDYLKDNNIHHRKTTPLWPQANGEVERQNRTLLKSMKITHAEGKNWIEELPTFLLAYRSTPHSTTGVSPAELLFKRRLRTKLPELSIDTQMELQSIRDADTLKKMEGKEYADRKRHATESNLGVGDSVLLKQTPTNKLSTPFEPEPYKIVEKSGSQVTLQSDTGRTVKRNITATKEFLTPVPESPSTSEAENLGADSDVGETEHAAINPPERRSSRIRREPAHLKDFVK